MTKDTEQIRVEIDHIKKDFTNHLALFGNDRILFSGPFGVGKTYFLKEYFKENYNSFIPIHLFPVNYSVADNKDIFELIKYDVLYELMKIEEIEFSKIDIPHLVHLPFFINQNLDRILAPFLKLIPELGRGFYDIEENLKELVNEYNTQHQKLQKGDEETANEFLAAFKDEIGGIYEENFHTELIKSLIGQLKTEDREVVLVIDDLDRIDPDHVFRIINVFSSHFDRFNIEENKFGFDRVILTCDYENIRNHFSHKYGNDSFGGYMDKFYSRNVYHFKNQQFVSTVVLETILSLEIIPIENGQSGASIPLTRRDILVVILEGIIELMINNNQISLRSLLKFRRSAINWHITGFQYGEKSLSTFDFASFLFYDVLVTLAPNIEEVLENILNEKNFVGSAEFNKLSISFRHQVVGWFIPTIRLDADWEREKSASEGIQIPEHPFHNLSFTTSTKSFISRFSGTRYADGLSIEPELSFFGALYIIVESLKKTGRIRRGL